MPTASLPVRSLWLRVLAWPWRPAARPARARRRRRWWACGGDPGRGPHRRHAGPRAQRHRRRDRRRRAGPDHRLPDPRGRRRSTSMTHGGKRVPAEIVGYDHETGFGLVRASLPLDVAPLPLGHSGEVAIGDRLLVLSRDGELGGPRGQAREPARVRRLLGISAARRPVHHAAAPGLRRCRPDRPRGRLVGIGSLGVGDATAAGVASPGNMFVPVDALQPILGDLLALGHRDAPGHPWVGVVGAGACRPPDRAQRRRRRPGRARRGSPGRRGPRRRRRAGRLAGRALPRHLGAGRSGRAGAAARDAREPGRRAQRAVDRPACAGCGSTRPTSRRRPRQPPDQPVAG